MDTRQLERFAQAARRQLHEEVAARLERVLRTDSAELRAKVKAIRALEAEIKASSREAVVERVAYTWFNRFIALRYMDVNGITRMGTVSPVTSATGERFTQPELLQEAKQGVIDDQFTSYVDEETVFGLLNGRLPSGDPQQEAYRQLLVAVCNAYHDPMPFLFQRIDDYTELLMPDDLLSEGSILQAVRDALTAETCRDVEVIGWLYQYYISEKKAAVMARKRAVPTEDIPAVTQLFTPHWIVRYMVENSLGRLWMVNHPGSRLAERMEYYITPDDDSRTIHDSRFMGQETGVKSQESKVNGGYPVIASPEEIRLCDPACGSGHILTYAFDLLYAIYEEAGYDPVRIPRLILEKNLTGIEIDPRAGALAGFALMMKAREKDRRFLWRGVQPDICVLKDVVFTPQELDDYMDAVGRDLFTQDVRDWLQQFERARTFGSLIRPLVTDTAFIRERLDEVGVFQDLFLSGTHDRVRPVLRMTEALSPRYHVVVANPPYMGSKGMNAELKRFAKDQYPSSRSDLCAMFIERGLELLYSSGYNAMVTMQSWMFLSSYEKLRKKLLKNVTIECMVHMANMVMGIAFGTAATVWHKHPNPEARGHYSFVAYEDLTNANEPFEFPVNNERLATATAADFKKIPGAPIAYWTTDAFRENFVNMKTLGTYFNARVSMATGDNARFLSRWYEVAWNRIGFGCRSEAESAVLGVKWFPCQKGGAYRKWYGNNSYVINWANRGEEVRSLADPGTGRIRSHNYNGDFAFQEAITWSSVSSSFFGVRYTPSGFLFVTGGSAGFPIGSVSALAITSFLCSAVASYYVKTLSATMNIEAGTVASVPYAPEVGSPDIASQLIFIAQSDWDRYETSWNFAVSPLLDESGQANLADSYGHLRHEWLHTVQETRGLEEKNNSELIGIYGLVDELAPDIAGEGITLNCNPHYRYGSSNLNARNWASLCEQFPDVCQQSASTAAEMAPDMPEEERLGLEQRLLGDTMREFISYAVGCMFGRYSLDKPGLILANQGETVEDYLRVVVGQTSGQWSVDSGQGGGGREEAEEGITFMPDEDNVIPMLDGDWFVDDVSERFKAFLRVTFGEAHYEENLAFIEAAIGRDIRSYFVRDFYKDHVKMYKKRPIYWLFSSPKGSFNALIYMHRYQPDTVSIVLNDYLREFRTKLSARRSHLEQVSISAAAAQRERTQALKEIERIDKVLNELRAYEDEVLYPLATERIEIDLDDGVLVNYKKFGRALKRVAGLSG